MIHTLLVPVHICHMYAFCGQSLYVATFHVDPTELNGFTTPEKKCSHSTSHPGWVAHWTHLSFSPKHNHWSSALKSNIYWRTSYIGLLGPYHQHVISTFIACSRGPTHRSLTNIGGGYNFRGVDMPHHTPWPSQHIVLRFSPKGPTRSQIINPTITNWTRYRTNPNSHEWEPPLNFHHKLSSKYSMC
jgi:hypothetical protein